MTTKAITGVGIQFQREDGSVFTTLAEITGFRGPDKEREVVDVTSFDSTGGYREFISSLRDPGGVSFDMNFRRDTYQILEADFDSDDTVDYQIIFPDSAGTTFAFSALITNLPVDAPLDDKVACAVTLKVTGPVTVT